MCRLYKAIAKEIAVQANPTFYPDLGFVENFPWLYYQNSPTSVIQKANRVKFRTSFDFEDLTIGIVKKMRYKLAKYDIYGNFYGFEDLTDQLVICEKSTDEIERIYQIGKTVEISCTFDLMSLISKSEYDRPKLENFFFELYLEDYNGDLIDIPALITNIISETGTTPN